MLQSDASTLWNVTRPLLDRVENCQCVTVSSELAEVAVFLSNTQLMAKTWRPLWQEHLYAVTAPLFPVAEALHGSAAKGFCSWRPKGHLLLPAAAILWEESADVCPAFCPAGRMKPPYSALQSHWNCSLCLVFSCVCMGGEERQHAGSSQYLFL